MGNSTLNRLISRRQLLHGLAGLGVAVALPAFAAPAPPLSALYAAWKRAFLQPDGRVIDPGQMDASTSEGQGYGMILALAAGDQAGFDAMWDWTQRHLAVRDDTLLAWRYLQDKGVP
ncbi:MAG: glycosyl hydrolase family 8, partial [Sulfurimicrobium sp.]